MNEPLGYSCDGGAVTIRMTEADYTKLLLYAGVATRHAGGAREMLLAWLNRLNVGNPDWTPYEVEDE
jgi:hypothetical protein